MIIFGIANIGTGIALNEPFLILSGALSAVGFSLVSANLQALISLESRPEQQGTVMGVAQSFAAFARVLGPIIGGAVATFHITLPYYMSGIAIFAVFAWGYKQLKYLRQGK